MEGMVLSEQEATEYEEFKRSRREAEIARTVKKFIIDASRRETDKFALKGFCDSAKKLEACSVLVTPVNVAQARRYLAGVPVSTICVVGGTGDSLPALKRAEAKKAYAQGAREVRFVPCYSALSCGNFAYLKKEIKKTRRAVKKCAFTLLLDDRALSEDEVALGVRAAREGGADGVCVRGEVLLVERALEAGAEQLRVDVSGVQNAEQLKELVRAGALRATTACGERIMEELYEKARLESVVVTVPAAPSPASEENTDSAS